MLGVAVQVVLDISAICALHAAGRAAGMQAVAQADVIVHSVAPYCYCRCAVHVMVQQAVYRAEVQGGCRFDPALRTYAGIYPARSGRSGEQLRIAAVEMGRSSCRERGG